MTTEPEGDMVSANAANALDELLAHALAYRTGGELRALVAFTCHFPQLAPYNAMLLHVQNPGIKFAARAEVWQDVYQRRILAGARPYVVLQTMGPVAFVFDVKDTEPIDPKHDYVPDSVLGEFPTRGQPPQGALAALTKACNSVHIEVQECDLEAHEAGRVHAVGENDVDFSITLNANHTEAQQLGTLAHELAHIFCGHLGETERGFWPDRQDTAIMTREVEAEAVAYFVTERMNLDVGSVRYLAGYVDDASLPAYSLENVVKAVGKIESMIQGRFRTKQRRRPAASDPGRLRARSGRPVSRSTKAFSGGSRPTRMRQL
jgi:hypothetical protein